MLVQRRAKAYVLLLRNEPRSFIARAVEDGREAVLVILAETTSLEVEFLNEELFTQVYIHMPN